MLRWRPGGLQSFFTGLIELCLQGLLNISSPSIVSRGGEMIEACKCQMCKKMVINVCPID